MLNLNQEEIRDLLNNPMETNVGGGMWSGETNSYDFLKAALKKDEKIQTAVTLHTQAGNGMTKGIGPVSGAPTQVSFDRHDAVSANEYIATLKTDETLIFTWKDDAAGIDGLILLDRSIFFQIYGLLFGGKKNFVKTTPLTVLEKKCLDRLLAPLIDGLQAVWKANGAIRFNITQFFETQESLSDLHINFDGYRGVWKISQEGMGEGFFSVLFPRTMLNALAAPEGESKTHDETKAVTDQLWVQAVTHAISSMTIPVSVRLGTMRLPLKNVLNIKNEEEFPLIIPESGQEVFINGHDTFRASIGTSNGQRAVRITHKLSETNP